MKKIHQFALGIIISEAKTAGKNMGLKLRFTKERLFISFYQVEEKSKFHFHERKGKERRIFLLFG